MLVAMFHGMLLVMLHRVLHGMQHGVCPGPVAEPESMDRSNGHRSSGIYPKTDESSKTHDEILAETMLAALGLKVDCHTQRPTQAL